MEPNQEQIMANCRDLVAKLRRARAHRYTFYLLIFAAGLILGACAGIEIL